MNIFERLFERNIIFCVVVSNVKLRKANLDISGKEYCIIAKRSDIRKHTMGFKTEHTRKPRL